MDVHVHEEKVVTRTWITKLSEEERDKLYQELVTLLQAAKVLPDGNTFSVTAELKVALRQAEVVEEDGCDCC